MALLLCIDKLLEPSPPQLSEKECEHNINVQTVDSSLESNQNRKGFASDEFIIAGKGGTNLWDFMYCSK